MRFRGEISIYASRIYTSENVCWHLQNTNRLKTKLRDEVLCHKIKVMGRIWMESSWHILGQLSVNCPLCAEVLCGLCFTASRCSHATKAKLKANIQMRPETEILFFSIRGWSLLIMVQLHWQQKTCNAVSCVGDDTWIRRCLCPSSSRLALPFECSS